MQKSVALSLRQKLLAFPWLVHGDGLGGSAAALSSFHAQGSSLPGATRSQPLSSSSHSCSRVRTLCIPDVDPHTCISLAPPAARLLIVPSHSLVRFSRPTRSSSSSPGASPPSKRRRVSESRKSAGRMHDTDEWRPHPPHTPNPHAQWCHSVSISRGYTHVLSTPIPNPHSQ